MKNLSICLSILFFFISVICIAQDNEAVKEKETISFEHSRKNDLKIGLTKLVRASILDIEYERLIGQHVSFGLNFVHRSSGSLFVSSSDIAFSPYCRVSHHCKS